MRSDCFVDRRAFVAGCVGAAGVLLLPAAHAAAGLRRLNAVSVIIDPKIDAAAAFGAALSRGGAQRYALTGDPYRCIRSVLSTGESPTTLAGMGTYADFILSTGALREARYALVSHGLHTPDRAVHRCFGEWAGCESVLQRSAAQWPLTLADLVAGYTSDLTPADAAANLDVAGTGVVVSWVMRSKPLRRFT